MARIRGTGAEGRQPILSADGEFYCSPRCGGGEFCRKSWYDEAVRKADELAALMGDGWEAVVWENLGWHYEVRKGHVHISVSDYERQNRDHGYGAEPAITYSAWIEVPGTPQIISESFIDPHDALGNAVQDARTMVARLEAGLAALNDVVSGGQP